MTSNNNVDMERLELLLREHFAKTEKQLADIRADNAEFRIQMKDEMNSFKDEVRNDMNSFKAEVRTDLQNMRSEMNSRFDNVQTQINVMQKDINIMQNDITGLKHDVANLFHWNYWILAIIIGVFVLPNFAEYIRGLFGAVRDGLAGIIALFRGKSNNM